jgi:hypothetical protein
MAVTVERSVFARLWRGYANGALETLSDYLVG